MEYRNDISALKILADRMDTSAPETTAELERIAAASNRAKQWSPDVNLQIPCAPRRAGISLGLFLVGPLTRPENHAGFLPFQLGLDVLMPADDKPLQRIGSAVGF